MGVEIIILILSPIVAVLIFCFVRTILVEGVKDDLAFPLGSCDTSMVEEVMDEKNEARCSE
jgi:hypothetical protein